MTDIIQWRRNNYRTPDDEIVVIEEWRRRAGANPSSIIFFGKFPYLIGGFRGFVKCFICIIKNSKGDRSLNSKDECEKCNPKFRRAYNEVSDFCKATAPVWLLLGRS